MTGRISSVLLSTVICQLSTDTMAEEKKLFKVTIDNITVQVEPGTSILLAARSIGGDVVPPEDLLESRARAHRPGEATGFDRPNRGCDRKRKARARLSGAFATRAAVDAERLERRRDHRPHHSARRSRTRPRRAFSGRPLVPADRPRLSGRVTI